MQAVSTLYGLEIQYTTFSPVARGYNGDVFGCHKPIYQQWTRQPLFTKVHFYC